MKVRNGFVSNSSSSSFTCDFCGQSIAGWDLCLEEAEMVECKHGHVVCEHHLKDVDIEELEEENEDVRYDFPEKYCPICGFTNVKDDDMLRYLLKKHQLKHDDVVQEIKDRFENYSDFVKFLK